MHYEHTIAMAQTLLAEGRAADVARMVEPLLGEAEEPEALLLHGLLARVRLLADEDPKRVLDGPLARYASPEALASLPLRLQADVALWAGWACALPGVRQDLPRALHLLRRADVCFARRLDVGGRLWARIGEATALTALGEQGLADVALDEAALFQGALRDEQASAWLRRLGREDESAPFVLPSVRAEVRRLADVRAPVLLRGEAGTGKQRLARALHAARAGTGSTFVSLSATDPPAPCSAETSRDEVQDALDAFPSGGTLYIGDVCRLSASAQARLLDVLTSAADRPRQRPTYVVASTHQDLGERVRAGAFSEALLHRLSVATADLPPLRERPFETALLVHHFMQQLRGAEAPAASITDRAVQALLRYAWPGNIRQLRNEIERALVFAGSEPMAVIDAGDLPGAITTSPPTRAPGARR